MKISFSKAKPEGRELLFVDLVLGDRKELVREGEKKILMLPIGKREEMTRRKLILTIRKVVAEAKANKIKKAAVTFDEFVFQKLKIDNGELAELMAVNFEMANYQFVTYKTPPKEGFDFVEEMIVVGNPSKSVQDAFTRGQIIGKEVNAVRELANTPGGDMTPRILAEKAQQAAKGTSVKVTVLKKSEIEKLKMGGVLGVAKGSIEEPRFIIAEYRGSGKLKPIVLVGKGVTFDTGGVSLKPADSMIGMNLDMSGGAAVIHTVILAAKLKLKRNVIALVPAVENMPSGSSYRPNDLLRTMSGKTIEVLNTDAEGRVILSDALTYAKRYDPTLVIDVATLTGAAMVALGQRASAIFTKDDTLAKQVSDLGEESGDYVWRLPLWEEYESEVKGTFGDVTNIHNKNSRYGGSINGAIFLYQFVKEAGYPWMHIDMAPRMEAVADEALSQGAAGAPVRLLIKLLERGV